MIDRVTKGHSVVALVLALCGVAAMLALLVLGGEADIFKGVFADAGNDRAGDDPDGGKLGRFFQAIERVREPANLAMIAVVPLGLAAGGGMLAIGVQQGMRLIGAAVGAAALVLLGNGIVA